MSENAFPFADDDLTVVEDAAGADRTRLLKIGGAALAAAVVLFGGFTLLGGGGGATESAAFTPIVPRVRSVPAVSGTAPKTTLPAAYNAQIGRDPFRALYVQPAAAAPAAPAAIAPGTVVVPGTSIAAGGGGGLPAQPAAAPAPANPTYKLVLGRVYGSDADRTATFTIDGKKELAKVGTKFGPTSEIILLSFQQGPKPGQWTTVLQVGDGDPFDVVTGVETFVR